MTTKTEEKVSHPMISNIIAFPGSKVACACGHQLAPPQVARHRLEFNTTIKACKVCGVDVMPFGTPQPVGKGLCACCISRPSTVRVEVGRGVWEPWCDECLQATDQHMVDLGLK